MADSHENNKTVPGDAVATPPPFNAAEILEQAAPSMVRIDGQHGGSGFFVTSDQAHSCEFATNYHVTDGAESTRVRTHDGKTYKAFVVKRDPQHDLAVYKLLEVHDPELTCRELPLSTTEPVTDEPVVAIGTDGFEDGAQHPRFHVGRVLGMITSDDFYTRVGSTYSRLDQEVSRPMVQTTDIMEHNYSGGPVVNSSGKVVAISEMISPRNGLYVGEWASFLQMDLDDIKNHK